MPARRRADMGDQVNVSSEAYDRAERAVRVARLAAAITRALIAWETWAGCATAYCLWTRFH